ncbi:autotransporter outer membrane beta-barrel domain-containing protein [Fusobacterium varium]|uniref:autotransporter outer membrane beta-barrel domain-containing protein n=1 Tax=Fusobacterium varium TaxID=856 RepID=UPI001F3AE5DA|nr:autotransporter outer membrane beta-barrel domain-containing protein [Fusobacterium varium]MCF2673333.1 autotransporter outer membrane beta-barrel domain-containing protein [Fusobacterium varium]
MIEKIIKAVKRGNKRRGRNITIGAVIGFLLSCTAVMGTDNYLWIKGDSGKIQFNTIITDDENGTKGNWNTTNPYKEITWNPKTKTYTNNMTLLSSAANGKDKYENISYGLRLSGDLTGVNFINNGSITGITSGSSGYNKGYGICNLAIMGNITNKGIISGYGSGDGTGSARGAGFGIYNNVKNNNIGNIENIGIISGYGNAIFSNGTGYGIYNAAPMGNVTNKGIISGYGYGSDEGWGIYNNPGTMSIINTGVISGTSFSAGYGINNSDKMESITNKGIISGSITSFASKYGYGIYNLSGKIGNITNKGVISGTGDGYGIANATITSDVGEIEVITNTGIIYGKDNAIKNDADATIGASNNYGILVNGDGNNNKVIDGLDIVDKTLTDNQILNKGLIFTALDTGKYKATAEEYKQFGKTYVDENIVIDYQEDGTGKPDLSNPITREYTIINAAALGDDEDSITGTKSLKLGNGTLTYGDSSTINISSNKRYILNGITNTLEVSGKNNELNDSVINAYKTAVVMEKNDSTLILNNTVVNGGLSGNDPTIRITGNKNILTIQGNSVVNGTMESTGENNTLNFNGNGENGINIMHKISGFSNMNIGENTNVTLFEKTIGTKGEETALEVSGVKEIDIKAGGVLNLRIDSQKSTDGRYEGHALFGNKGLKINGDISQLSDGKTELEEIEDGKYKVGVFNLVTNGLGINSIIAMDGITLNENLFVKTNSILDKATIIKNPSENEKEGDIKIEGEKDIFEMYVDKSKRYIKLNEIYKGIYSSEAENFNALKDILTLSGAGGDYTSVTYKDQLARLLSYLSNIYTGTPYSYSSELSRKSMGMFRDIITENQFKPNLNQWLIIGGLTHRDGGTKDTYYGKNYHGFDTGTADVDVDMKLTGAYALGKYGYSENVSLGVTVGGNRSEAKLPMSKVKGNSGYIGAFAENYRGNLTLKAGAGIQYSEYDANRATLGGHSYSDKYSDMTYDIYLNGRYSHSIGENLFLEPYGTLSYTYVDQEGADEGSKVLAIETDSKSFDYTAAKVGVDLKKVIPHEKGKSTLSAGVSYTRLLNGADEENITGRFKGENATDFDILVAHKNEHSIGLNAKYALELESGILFDVKGSYSVERDSHNGTGKNRNKGEWIVGAGLGYKF